MKLTKWNRQKQQQQEKNKKKKIIKNRTQKKKKFKKFYFVQKKKKGTHNFTARLMCALFCVTLLSIPWHTDSIECSPLVPDRLTNVSLRFQDVIIVC